MQFNGGNFSLIEVFKRVIDEESNKFMQHLSRLPDHTSITISYPNGRIIKGAAVEQVNGQYYSSFAKNIFDVTKGQPKAGDCYLVDEIADLLGRPELKALNIGLTKADIGKFHILGPLDFSKTVSLHRALNCVGIVRDVQAEIAENVNRVIDLQEP